MKNNAIRRNFIVSIVLIMALLIIIPVITLYLLRQEYDARIRTETAQASTSIRQTVRAFVDGAYNLSYELAENPLIQTMDGEIQTPIVVSCVERNEYLELLFIQGMDGHQTARSSGTLGYRGDRAWFLEVTEHRQPCVYKSYYSMATGMPVTSVFIPIYDGAEMVGIFGADISLQYFQHLAEQFEDAENGRLSFIIDGEGAVVAHPDIEMLETITNFKTQTRMVPVFDEHGNKLLNENGSIVEVEEDYPLSDGYQAVIEMVMAGERGLELIEEDGRTFYASYESIAMPGYSDAWAVITLQDRDIAMSVISDLLVRVFIIISVILVVFIVIAFGFFGSLNRTMVHLETARNEAEEANRSKSAFLSTMSHEIRTPMNAILGITEIQLQNSELQTEVRAGLEKTYSSGHLLLNIINDILDLSKIEAGRLELVIDKYEIASMISDTAQLNMMRIGSKPIEFEVNADENIPMVLLGDELRVKQILNNLLSNAFKYTKEGKVELKVSAEDADADTFTLVLRVSDTGQGMTEEQVSMLFGEYTRFNMEANRRTEGAGLGLSITHRLVQLMDGEISVESQPGAGSIFTVRVKQTKVGSDVLGKELADNLRRFRAGNRAQLERLNIKREPMPYGSVMIVDDVETNIYVATGLLAPYGMKLDSAESGFEAIEKIKKGNVYDIVFMDHMMPDMDGIETTRRIREMGYKHPIVALTANAVSGQAEMFLSSGFDDFISKPIDMRQMNAILNKLIRDKQPPEVIEAARQAAVAQGVGVTDVPPSATEGDTSATLNPRVVEIFARDANKSLAILERMFDRSSEFDEADLRLYTINTHGMKTALANIGKTELSEAARALEALGREGNIEAIAKETPPFLKSLRALVEEVAPKEDSGGDEKDSDPDFLREKLQVIKAACEGFDSKTADIAVKELKAKTWSKPTAEMLSTVSEHLLHSDFDEVVRIIEGFLK